ncbi:MAG: [FeFe] hydrogenase H-cluster maturation GTPase HydF [Bacteroidales bacterium]|nr:[FeFe] hydrogenase H-cluster maturation GTPase HydF [Bacteroidales bacterium]
MKTKRVFIGIFGRRNKGKSSLINALCNQPIAIVSPEAGTTTDPVKKTMEIFGIGPTVLIDTAGIDDEGDLGRQRIEKTLQVIPTIDVAIIVLSDNEFIADEQKLCETFQQSNIPFLFVHNKEDMTPMNSHTQTLLQAYNVPIVKTNSKTRENIDNLIDKIISITPPSAYQTHSLIGDLINKNDKVVLVMPIDEEAPEGRLILPQIQTIRDILDNEAICISLQPQQLSYYLQTETPKLVITDSQAFGEVNKIVPQHIPLTSFSIILARAKGHFDEYLHGTQHIMNLKDNDHVLLLESCSHPVHCQDIGHYKIPNLLQKVTGKQLHFAFVSSLSPLPENLHQYSLAIQCGACMVTDKQVQNRIKTIVNEHIPVSNYGMTLAFLNGIFNRSVELFV